MRITLPLLEKPGSKGEDEITGKTITRGGDREGGGGEWKDFPWCFASNYIITIRSSRDLSFRHGRCQDDLAVCAIFRSLEVYICSLQPSSNPKIHDSHEFSLFRDMLCPWTLEFSKRVVCSRELAELANFQMHEALCWSTFYKLSCLFTVTNIFVVFVWYCCVELAVFLVLSRGLS